MLRKDFGLEIKEVDSSGFIKGYGSTFGGEPDSYGDIIIKGAFAETIKDHSAKGTMPLMLWGHNSSELPIGDWTLMEEDSKGLYLEGQVDLDDPVGARVYSAMKRKSVRGLSIGYETIEAKEDPKRRNVNLLSKLNLWEVSPVNFPANRNATITDVKTIRSSGLPTLPEFEQFLREAGFSKTEATAVASKGLAQLLRSESGSETDAALSFLKAMASHK
jgi:HK97 family phage prohead protease